MNDYQMEFLGQIEKKGFGWAYRASDNTNFYATKIQIVKPGPLPSADLLRYAVVHGQERQPGQLAVADGDPERHFIPCAVNRQGDSFTTSVNGQVVDTWTDNRLKSGGVGFFTRPRRSCQPTLGHGHESRQLRGSNLILSWILGAHRARSLGRRPASASLKPFLQNEQM